MTTKELAFRIAAALKKSQDESGVDRRIHLNYVWNIERIFLDNYRVLDGSVLKKWRDCAGTDSIDIKV